MANVLFNLNMSQDYQQNSYSFYNPNDTTIHSNSGPSSLNYENLIFNINSQYFRQAKGFKNSNSIALNGFTIFHNIWQTVSQYERRIKELQDQLANRQNRNKLLRVQFQKQYQSQIRKNKNLQIQIGQLKIITNQRLKKKVQSSEDKSQWLVESLEKASIPKQLDERYQNICAQIDQLLKSICHTHKSSEFKKQSLSSSNDSLMFFTSQKSSEFNKSSQDFLQQLYSQNDSLRFLSSHNNNNLKCQEDDWLGPVQHGEQYISFFFNDDFLQLSQPDYRLVLSDDKEQK